MANLFRNLPHLLGSITNLDGAQSMRALISINAELKRRQRLFSENNVNHINQYQKLYKDGDVSEPMPHLFLISDEFAELKSEQPEFMKELVSTARIGRSLGIHLILATQKPSGVVDDQIWSNSKFKLALKVADKSDSMEMLKTPDAAEITQPGRAYLQVGNNEIYELFQSAWSGADYLPDQSDQEEVDNTIYAINDLGQYEILSEDLSGLSDGKDVQTVPTELDAVIDGIHDITENEGIAPLPRPWLPPLEERVYLPELDAVDYHTAWQEKSELEPLLGIADIPSMQAQESFRINLSKDGHIAVYSSPGYGKSTFLQTIMMGLARTHSPARLHAYLLDFGTNGLLPLRSLPHVADTMNIDEEEKIGKFMRRMMTEMKRRKQMLSQFAVASLEMYEKASGQEEPRILLLVDGFEGFKGSKYETDLETVLGQIAREGSGIGMHLVVAAGRQGSMRVNLQSNIKVQLAMKMIDDNEPRGIVGRTSLTIEDVKGRGLIKFEEPVIFQGALPTVGEDTLGIIEEMQREAREMDEAWDGERAEPIPMIPDVLDFEEYRNKKKTIQQLEQEQLSIGLDFENVEPIGVDMRTDSHLLVLGSQQEVLSSFLEVLVLESLAHKTTKVAIYDDSLQTFRKYKEQDVLYEQDSAKISQFISKLVVELEDREDQFEDENDLNDAFTIKDFVQNVAQYFIFIPEHQLILDTMDKDTEKNLTRLLVEGEKYGLHFMIAGQSSTTGKPYDDVSSLLKKMKKGIVIGKVGDQSVLEASNISYREPNLNLYEAYLIMNNQADKLKIPVIKN